MTIPGEDPNCTAWCRLGSDCGHVMVPDETMARLRAAAEVLLGEDPASAPEERKRAVVDDLYQLDSWGYHAIADALGQPHEWGFLAITGQL